MMADDKTEMVADHLPGYRSRIREKTLNQPQPEMDLEERFDEVGEAEEAKATLPGMRLGGWLVLFALISVLAFSLTDAVLMIWELFDAFPWFSLMLAAILSVFVLLLVLFFVREWRGYVSVGRFLTQSESLEALERKDDKSRTLATLKHREHLQSSSAFARQCYREFHQVLRVHHSNAEILRLYRDRVVLPMQTKAKQQLNKVSMTSGGFAFLSPNSLIQSVLFVWMGLRTLRLIAQTYGLRTGWAGNWRLLRLALEGLAVTSVIDLLGDEMVSHLGGGIGAKILDNSAEAMAAGGMNYRLGRSLIRQLDQAFAE